MNILQSLVNHMFNFSGIFQVFYFIRSTDYINNVIYNSKFKVFFYVPAVLVQDLSVELSDGKYFWAVVLVSIII